MDPMIPDRRSPPPSFAAAVKALMSELSSASSWSKADDIHGRNTIINENARIRDQALSYEANQVIQLLRVRVVFPFFSSFLLPSVPDSSSFHFAYNRDQWLLVSFIQLHMFICSLFRGCARVFLAHSASPFYFFTSHLMITVFQHIVSL